jgi:CO/xanthine dehydrogenase FAD-binding subunit
MGTVGGNLFAPPPSGDFATALLALDARVKLSNQNGERILPLEEFWVGFMANVLSPDELLSEIQISVPRGSTAFLKYGRRHANTPAIVTVAAVVDINDGVVKSARLALNGVGPHPVRAKKAEEFLINRPLNSSTSSEAGEIAVEDCEPFTDAVASEWYRRKMIPVIIRRTLDKIPH